MVVWWIEKGGRFLARGRWWRFGEGKREGEMVVVMVVTGGEAVVAAGEERNSGLSLFSISSSELKLSRRLPRFQAVSFLL